jgi:hypothetical protein
LLRVKLLYLLLVEWSRNNFRFAITVSLSLSDYLNGTTWSIYFFCFHFLFLRWSLCVSLLHWPGWLPIPELKWSFWIGLANAGLIGMSYHAQLKHLFLNINFKYFYLSWIY